MKKILTFALISAFALGATTMTSCGEKEKAKPKANIVVATTSHGVSVKVDVEIWLGGSGTATIDWGDGAQATELLVSGAKKISHTYDNYRNETPYTISIYGDAIGEFSFDQRSDKPVYATTLEINNSPALTVVQINDNELTELDLSGLAMLRTFEAESNKLTSVDISGCTALQTVFLRYNKLEYVMINTIFSALPSVVEYSEIVIGGNTGFALCNQNIAIAKGWTVYDTDY